MIIATLTEEMLLELGYSEIRLASSVDNAPWEPCYIHRGGRAANEVRHTVRRTSRSDIKQLAAAFKLGVMLPKPVSLERYATPSRNLLRRSDAHSEARCCAPGCG